MNRLTPTPPTTARRSQRWGAALALAVLLLVAGCGDDSGSTALTTKDDPSLESVADASAAQDPTTGESSPDTVGVNAGDAQDPENDPVVDPPQAPLASAPAEDSSPADRQNSQSVGGAEPEVVELAADASGQTSDTDEQGSASGDGVAEQPAGPVFDVPVFPGSGQSNQGTSAGTAETSTEPGQVQNPVFSLAQDLPEDSCGDSCEVGGFEASSGEVDGVAPADPIQFVDEPSDEQDPLPESIDDQCPAGSDPECKAILEVETSEAADVNDVENVEPVANCETRPWGRGCPGPVPDYSESEELLEQPEDPQDPVESAEEGVFVSQEVQDLLLSPVPKPEAKVEPAK